MTNRELKNQMNELMTIISVILKTKFDGSIVLNKSDLEKEKDEGGLHFKGDFSKDKIKITHYGTDEELEEAGKNDDKCADCGEEHNDFPKEVKDAIKVLKDHHEKISK